MKCIRCGHDSKYKDRSDRRCPNCHREFAFEPQQGDILTDVAFQHAIEVVSAGGRIKWGVEHLYYEVCRRRRSRPSYIRTVIVGLVALGVLVALSSGSKSLPLPLLMLVVMGITAVIFYSQWQQAQVATVKVDRPTFDGMWSKWVRAHGDPPGLIVRQERTEQRRPVEADLGDYSFDRAVICDRARTADLLLANNFHFENNCAILAVGGYPTQPFETVRAMLKRNPKLKVLALHDCTLEGCQLARRLAGDPAWFKDQVPVVDVGLRPVHAKPLRGLYQRVDGVVPMGEGISTEEAAWLSQYRLELAAIRPEQVLKRLFRAMQRGDGDSGGSGDGGGGDVLWVGSGGDGGDGDFGVSYDLQSFGVDAGASDGGADSFG